MFYANIVTVYDTIASTTSRHRICEMLTGFSDSAPVKRGAHIGVPDAGAARTDQRSAHRRLGWQTSSPWER
jgi:hypothetical protein